MRGFKICLYKHLKYAGLIKKAKRRKLTYKTILLGQHLAENDFKKMLTHACHEWSNRHHLNETVHNPTLCTYWYQYHKHTLPISQTYDTNTINIAIPIPYLARASTPEIDAWAEPYAQSVLLGPVHQVQVKVILEFRSIQDLEGNPRDLPDGLEMDGQNVIVWIKRRDWESNTSLF